MKFQMTKEEKDITDPLSTAAYNSHVLVNDYFSWEKEWEKYQAEGCQGEIISAVFLFMKWYSLGPVEAKEMLRSEIRKRELRYCDRRAAHLARGDVPEKTIRWVGILDCINAGNFLWSMTTARYIVGAEDSYPALRAAHLERRTEGAAEDYIAPICPSKPGLTSSEQNGNGSNVSTASGDHFTSNGPCLPQSDNAQLFPRRSPNLGQTIITCVTKDEQPLPLKSPTTGERSRLAWLTSAYGSVSTCP